MGIYGNRANVYRALGTSQGANVKSSEALLLSIYCFNDNAAVRYFQLFNSTVAPTGTPVISYPVAADGSLILDTNYFGGDGIVFSAGLTWGISTALGTYTAATAADTVVEIFYR